MWARWALAGLALFCAGCELRLEIEAAFERDGGGRLEVALSADEELLAQAQAVGSDPLGDLAATGQDLGTQGWQVADTTDDAGSRTVALTAVFDGPEAFDRLAAELAGTLTAPEVDLLSPLTVTVDDDRLVVDGTASLQPTDAVEELGLTPEQTVALLRERDAFSYVLRIALPGEVLASTATAEEGGTLSWRVEPGEQVTVHAVGRRPGAPVWPLVLGAIVGLLVAALGVRRVAVLRRRR